jgi:hypothetical protein
MHHDHQKSLHRCGHASSAINVDMHHETLTSAGGASATSAPSPAGSALEDELASACAKLLSASPRLGEDGTSLAPSPIAAGSTHVMQRSPKWRSQPKFEPLDVRSTTKKKDRFPPLVPSAQQFEGGGRFPPPCTQWWPDADVINSRLPPTPVRHVRFTWAQ